MALSPEKLADFVELTLNEFAYNKWTDLSLELPEYMAMQFIKRNKVEYVGGTEAQWQIKTKNSGNARRTGMFAQDVTNIEDVMTSAKIPLRMQTTNFSYSIYEEGFQADDYRTIVRLLKVREHDALSDMAELLEEELWGLPATPDENRCFGIPYWIQKDPGTSGATNSGDYTANVPSGHTAVGIAGLNPATQARWRNWAFGWEQITRDDFVLKFKRALRYTKFMAPVPFPSTDSGSRRHEAFSTLKVVEGLEALAEDRNDNHGPDVARYMNEVTVAGVPVKHVFHLTETDTTDPVYGIDHAKFQPVCKSDCEMKRHPPKDAPHQHDTKTVHYDNWMNFKCVDRRGLFVGSRPAA